MRNSSTATFALAALLTLVTVTLAGCSRDATETPATAEARQAAGPCETPLETRQRNVVFRPKTAEQWLMMFGGA